MKKSNVYQHRIELKTIKIENCDKKAFADKLMDLPYRGYEVETLEDARKIVITKPGGKNVYGKPKKEDFLVFIYNPEDSSLWQISHNQILEDIKKKVEENEDEAQKLLILLKRTFDGEEPDTFINEIRALSFQNGEKPEALIKVYKWIWGQEDINYPNGEGRFMSWHEYEKLMITV